MTHALVGRSVPAELDPAALSVVQQRGSAPQQALLGADVQWVARCPGWPGAQRQAGS